MYNKFIKSNLDLEIFANRNKEYGAYFLRHNYSKNMTRGMLIGIALFLSIVLFGFFYSRANEEDLITTVYIPPATVLPEIPSLEIPKKQSAGDSPAAPLVENVKTEIPKVVEDVAEKEVEKQEEKVYYKEMVLPQKNEAGKGDSTSLVNNNAEGKGSSNLPSSPQSTSLQTRPYFPNGGDPGFVNYLRQNLKYPEEARKKKIKGIVTVSFVVTKTGEITSPKIVQGLGYGCDEEVIRVISAMPRWIPGNINGNVIALKLTQKIEFDENI